LIAALLGSGRVPVLGDYGYLSSSRWKSPARNRHACGWCWPAAHFLTGQPELLEYHNFARSDAAVPVKIRHPATIRPKTVRSPRHRAFGLKDSSASMIYFRQVQHLLEDRPDFTLLMGPEQLLAESVLLGAHGGVCGGANLLPRLYVDLYGRSNKRPARVEPAQDRDANQRPSTASAIRIELLKGPGAPLLGICSDFRRAVPPFREPSEDFGIRSTLKNWDSAQAILK
jgi:4-hydroxy-tetrahydrodipicolinate synthase